MKFIQMPDHLPRTPWQPAADVYNCPQGWLVKFELAGVRPQEVEVNVHGCCLTVSGIRRDWLSQQDNQFYSMEISYNRFHRSVELPCDLEMVQIATEYRYGMLLVHLSPGTKPQ